MKKIIAISLFALLSQALCGQNYSVSTIPDSLLVDADAVVRYEETVFTQTDINNGIAKYTTVITVMKEDGAHHADIIISQDRFRELKSFSGVILHPETGKVIKKIAKTDLSTSAYSPNMSSDDKYSYYRHQASSFPFTVKYEYEIRHKNGIPAYPSFTPIGAFGVSVEQAEYTLVLPASQKMRYKAMRMDKGDPEVKDNGTTVSYSWKLENVAAVRSESFAPSLRNLVPMVTIAPVEFCMEGKCGNMSSWESLGYWHYTLLEGRDAISEDTKQKLQGLTTDANSEKEKVKKIFEHLQSTTRYVSIQLGIGGLQPISAASVAKSGFGDCKGLSNYMKAMLSAVGIPSVYVAISVDRPDLYNDFASLTQMNHVILMVPLPNDTLWLECTNQQLPFSYLHSGIAGHQSLLVKESGSAICRVKKVDPVIEKAKTLNIAIDKNGQGEASVHIEYRRDAYERMMRFVYDMSKDEQLNYLAENMLMPKVKISDLKYTSNNSEDPDIQVDFKMVADGYANKTGSRLFIPLSSVEIGSINVLKGGKRRHDIVITSTSSVADTLQIEVPEGCEVESVPKSTVVSSEFGSYSVDIAFEGRIVRVVQSLSLKPGTYSAEKAQDFQDFLKKVDKESKRKAVFKLQS